MASSSRTKIGAHSMGRKLGPLPNAGDDIGVYVRAQDVPTPEPRGGVERSGVLVVTASPGSFLRSILLAMLLAATGCASTSVPLGRLADGSPVPKGASFSPPVLVTKMPLDRLARVGSAGVRGIFRAELIISEEGLVVGESVTHSLGDAADAELLPVLRRLVFTPAVLDGKPVAVMYSMTLNFTSLH